jgi:hypothetical protein
LDAKPFCSNFIVKKSILIPDADRKRGICGSFGDWLKTLSIILAGKLSRLLITPC